MEPAVRRISAFVLAATLASPADAAVWPDTIAPCNTTLQACINGTASGGAVLVLSSAVIDESLTINKPFALRAGPGHRPVLAADRSIGATIATAGSWSWILEGFELTRGQVTVNVDAGNASVVISRVRVRATNLGLAGINLSNDSPGSIFFDLSRNEVDFDWSTSDGALRPALQVLERGAGSANGRISENRVVARGTQSIGILLQTEDKTNRISVAGNHVAGGPRGSIYLRQGSLVAATGGTLTATVVNNVVRSIDAGAASAYGIKVEILDGAASANVLHNTVVDAFRGVDLLGSSGTGPIGGRVGRNLFAHLAFRGLDRSGPFDTTNTPDDRNLFFATADAPASVAPDSIFADPLLASSADPHLRAGSPAIDAADGSDFADVLATEDLRALDGDGLRRFKRVLAAAPAFPADLGALEFGDSSPLFAVASGSGITAQIDDAALNAKPTAYPQSTANWNPDGAGGVYANHAVSLFYSGPSTRWNLRREDLDPLVAGSDFNLFVPAEGAGRYRHANTAASISGSETQLDAIGLNGRPNVLVLATRDPTGSPTVVDLTSPIAVRYASSRWSVLRLDGGPMPASGGFGIYFQDESYNAFRQVASSANTLGNFTLIDHTPINGQRCARIHVAQAPTGTLNNHHIGVFYSPARARWAIFNEDLAAMPAGAQFFVLVDPARTGCADGLFSDGFEGEATATKTPTRNPGSSSLP